jgi:AP2-associated kinase
MTTGAYEVFILMEYCPGASIPFHLSPPSQVNLTNVGGGIIDMMNRRLRERLTEAEIFQIFVDVCEGVAAMHNLRPPLLHRDLKVENILQSTPNSYKLCDFGSATPVAPRPPATTQEIRMVEADLNRHTTLQYRAPEMVDPYLRRPIDEKSDVWALGVLLYKLCYYTTPFEEHGPLAILNVNYRFPLYPVYSSQMNGMIGWFLLDAFADTCIDGVLFSVHAHGTRRSETSRFRNSRLSPSPPRNQVTLQLHHPSANPSLATFSPDA